MLILTRYNMAEDTNTNPTENSSTTPETPVVGQPSESQPISTTPTPTPEPVATTPKPKRTRSPKQPPKRTLRTSVKYAIVAVVIALFAGTGYVATRTPTPVGAPTPTGSVVSVAPTNTPVITTGGKCHVTQENQNDSESVIPDPNCTPGSLNPNVTQANIASTICMKGYTTTIRPPVSYTNQLKVQSIANYGYSDTNTKDYEEDHFIPLELGGNPTDVKNLWAEFDGGSLPNKKDYVENYLHAQVCNGNITLQAAQHSISTNWYSIYQQVFAL